MTADHDPDDEHVGELVICRCGRTLCLREDGPVVVTPRGLSGRCACGDLVVMFQSLEWTPRVTMLP